MTVTALKSQAALPGFEGLPITKRQVRFSGKAPLDVEFEVDTAFIESLPFGREVTVTVRCTVVGKGYAFDEGSDTEDSGAVHDIRLRVDQIVL